MTPSAIVHLGVGAFHRAHQAPLYDALLQQDPDSPWSVCGVGVLPGDAVVRDGLRAQGFAYTLLLKHPDGAVERSVVRSVRDMLLVPEDPEAVVARLADPATRLVTLTVTEGGWTLDTDAVRADLVPGAVPRSAFGVLVAALRRRRDAGVPPFTVLSCDNVEGNGHVARAAVAGFARQLDPDLGDWVDREVAFPSSMVDRIAPVVTDADRELAGEAVPVVAEPWLQWVLEDDFPLGRPELERVGVQLVPDVRPYELMKLRLLNGGHQAVAYAGLLLGHVLVHDAVADPDVRALLQAYLDDAAPSLAPVPGVDLADYRAQLVVRFGNAAVRDTLARLADVGHRPAADLRRPGGRRGPRRGPPRPRRRRRPGLLAALDGDAPGRRARRGLARPVAGAAAGRPGAVRRPRRRARLRRRRRGRPRRAPPAAGPRGAPHPGVRAPHTGARRVVPRPVAGPPARA